MNRVFAILLCFFVVSCSSSESKISTSSEPVTASVENRYGIVEQNYKVVKGSVKRGDFFGEIMMNLGVDGNGVQEILNASKGIFDVRKFKIGDNYEVYYERLGASNGSSLDSSADSGDGSNVGSNNGSNGDSYSKNASYFIYELDKLNNIVFSLKDSIYAKVVEKEIELKRKFAEVTINNSLWVDVTNAGCSPVLALKLSDIYDCTIDFIGLQKGDSFKVIYDEQFYEGEFLGVNDVYYAEFTHDGTNYKAVRYEESKVGSKFWNEKGESLKKAFLKAPLNFTRISSRFTYARKHPVLKIVRPHTGVDYAAPSGTPVVTIGDGVVTFKGWTNGGGNTLKIRHNSTYTTSYMHLRGFAKGLAVGKRLKQGELIGYVGSTGLSTGPHLDFRVYKHGTPINPLTMESPSIEPLPKSSMPAFLNEMEGYVNEISRLEVGSHFNDMIWVLE